MALQRIAAFSSLVFVYAACGGGSPPPPPTETSYHIIGQVMMLTGSVTLQLNGGETIEVGQDGSFRFLTPVPRGSTYDVTVVAQPFGQLCSVFQGSGTVTGSVTDVSVQCWDHKWRIDGTITGVDSVWLENAGTDAIRASGAANDWLPPWWWVPAGSSYDVTVQEQPLGHTCTVVNGSGIATADVRNVAVTCEPNQYAISGTISGLTRPVTLQNNGGDDLVLTEDGPFLFRSPVPFLGKYAVEISAQSVGQICFAAYNNGTVHGDVDDVLVTCSPTLHRVAGAVWGLVGSVTLLNNGGDALVSAEVGRFEFATPIAFGSTYDVTISEQPADQSCGVTNGHGTVTGEVYDIVVECVNRYLVHVNVAGLEGSVELLNGDSDTITVTADGDFTFPTKVPFGADYRVTVARQPDTQTCTVGWGSGTMRGDAFATVVCADTTHSIGGEVNGLVGSVTLQNDGGDDLVLTSDGPFVFPYELAYGSRYEVTVSKQPGGQTCTIAYPWGPVYGDVTRVVVTCAARTFTIGGHGVGLAGPLILSNNGMLDSRLLTDGAFVLERVLASGSRYDVRTASAPPGQTCSVSNGTGVALADVTDVVVSCAETRYAIGGTVRGLDGSVSLRDQGGNTIVVSTDGPFAFPGRVLPGGYYSVTVATQPVGQTCTVTKGSGTATSDVSNILVECTVDTYMVSGRISGVAGSVTLENNGADRLVLTADGLFRFATLQPYGSTYDVAIVDHPLGRTCEVRQGTGTVWGPVTTIEVACVADTHAVEGSLIGVSGSVTLHDDGAGTLVLTADGPFAFPMRLTYGSAYDITIVSAPVGQSCQLTNGSGTVTGDVTDVVVVCTTITYPVAGDVSGLAGTIALQLDGADTLVLVADGPFEFATWVPYGSSYEVTVSAQPPGQTCTVERGSGTVTGAEPGVLVTCETNAYSIAGTISGLRGSAGLRNNGGEELVLTSDGPFSFVQSQPYGSSYEVTVSAQPEGQICTVTNGSGMVAGDVTSIEVTCASDGMASIGGTVSGLAGTVYLQNNGADALALSADGPFRFPARLPVGSPFEVTVWSQPNGQICTVENAAGIATADVTDVAVTCVSQYAVVVLVSGLVGSAELQNNGTDTLTVAANTAYAFSQRIPAGSTFDVTVSRQPAIQTCSVVAGSGTALNRDVRVWVRCGSNTHSIGGTLVGLAGSVTLQNGGADDLVLTGDGSFVFSSPIQDGGSYDVTVSSQPAGQTCSVAHGTGTAAADVSDVVVTCVADQYVIGGTIRGIQGSITLQNNAGDDLVLDADGAFVFAAPVAAGSTYDVTVSRRPTGQTCTIANGSGTATADVTDILVTCETDSYTVGGTIAGLSGTVTLQNDAGDDLVLDGDGSFVFGAPIAAGSTYDVTVSQQPTGQTCTIANGSGIASADVIDVLVTCEMDSYTVGGTVTGLTGAVTLQNNGGDALTVTADGGFTFGTPLTYLSTYAVSVSVQPAGQVCSVQNAVGTVIADVTDVIVTCVTPEGTRLDPAFGEGGIVIAPLSAVSDHVNDIAIQADGKIVAVGSLSGADDDFFVARFATDGSIDVGFGGGGTFLGSFAPGTDGAMAVALRGDGYIVAVGTVTTVAGAIAPAVVRLSPDGTPDPSFAGTGQVVLSVPGHGLVDQGRSVALQSDGKIVIGGMVIDGTTYAYDSVLARLNADGTMDTGFGTSGDGFVVTSLSPWNDAIEDIAIAGDGAIIVAGYGDRAEGSQSALVARFTSGGTLDTTFHGTGVSLETTSDLTMGATSVVLDAASRPVVCGGTVEATGRGLVSRRSAAGELDTSFDADGWWLLDASVATSVFHDVAVQGDGKFLAAGTSGDAFVVARLTPDGAPDVTFGGGGIASFTLGTDTAAATSIAIQTDGKYVAAGYLYDGTRYRTAMIRLVP